MPPDANYVLLDDHAGVPIKAWVRGVPVSYTHLTLPTSDLV